MSLFSSIKTGMKKRTLSERIVFAIVWCIFCFVAISYLSIFVWCFMSGLKTHTQVLGMGGISGSHRNAWKQFVFLPAWTVYYVDVYVYARIRNDKIRFQRRKDIFLRGNDFHLVARLRQYRGNVHVII